MSVACAVALVAAPAPARAETAGELFGGYSTLAQEERTPAPLVPLTLPRILGSGEHSLAEVLTGGHGVYRLVYKHFAGLNTGHGRPDALVALANLGTGTPAGRRRSLGAGLFTATPTHVRGHAALLLHGRFSSELILLWREDGRLYEVGTGTPRTVSLAAMRSLAAGLQHLLGSYTAQLISPDGGTQEAEALLVERALYLNVSWTAPCRTEAEAPDRSASAVLGWVPLAAGAFSRSPFTVADTRGGAPWSVSLSGTLAAGGGQVGFQASSASGAESCAIGPLTLTLKRLPRLRKLP